MLLVLGSVKKKKTTKLSKQGSFHISLGGACLYRSVNQVCVEKSLIFRSNTPYSTDIVPDPGGRDPLFCVQLDDCKQYFFSHILLTDCLCLGNIF